MSFLGATLLVFAGALVTSGVGWATARFFDADISRPEKVAWSFATGLLVQSALFFAVVSVLPGRALFPLLALDAAIVSASFLIRRSQRPTRKPSGRAGISVISLIAIAGAAWLVFLVSALSEPMWSTDYLAIWGLKAKTIALTGHVPARLFSDPALYWAHREYPLLLPVSLAMLAGFVGGWNDHALALLFPLCQLATLAAAYGFLAHRISRFAGAAAAALTALCFPLYRAVNVGTADVPFAFSAVLVSIAFLDSLSNRSRAEIARLAVASLFCVSIKQEGMVLVLLLAAALWIRRRWTAGWALTALAVLHRVILDLLRGPQRSRDFELSLLKPARWDEFFPRLGTALERMGGVALAAWVAVIALALFLLVTRRGLADSLLAVLLAQILAYTVAYATSSFGPAYAVESSFGRLAAALFPALTLVFAARVERKKPAGIAASEIG